MNDNYATAFDTLMWLEGYKSDVAGDSGGLTIWGITERWWPADVKKMQEMAPEDAKQYARRFYYDHYWLPNHCDVRLAPDDTITFCIAVNNGMKQYDADTWEGDLLGSVERYLTIVEKNPSQMKFFKGWMSRVVKLWRLHRGASANGDKR
jgi:lysozyme family protein